MVLDHLDNRYVNCPPYTAATISRNRLFLSPGIHGISLALSVHSICCIVLYADERGLRGNPISFMLHK